MPRNRLFIFSFKERSAIAETFRFLGLLALLVALPSLLMLGIIERVGWRTGVTMSPAQLAQLQHQDPQIIWAGDGQYYGPFKVARIALEQPELVFIGPSTCNEVRSAMFRPYSFYNACMTAWTISQMRTILDRITQVAHPRVVFVSLDYFMLTEQYVKRWQDKANMDFYWGPGSSRDQLIRIADTFKLHPLRLAYELPQYLLGRARHHGFELTGIGALAGRAGFRLDGSLLYTDSILAMAPSTYANYGQHLFAAVAHGDGAHIAPREFNELREFGELAQVRGVTLVGIQLPFIKGAVDILDSGRDYQGFLGSDTGVWRELLSPQMRETLRGMGIHFFDTTHNPIAADSRAFIDPAHPAERGDLATLIGLAEQPEFHALLPKLDLARLKSDYAEAVRTGSYFDVYHDKF
jgi:hypothetical protein